jgi:hypothetical protein
MSNKELRPHLHINQIIWKENKLKRIRVLKMEYRHKSVASTAVRIGINSNNYYKLGWVEYVKRVRQ